ncbi:nuclear transport factor 2 family protein [Streptomyces sp. NPDC047315]|uniref:nuclear transport factor 2 family protein n=1 Tax=Streptomyces sp. NPDC047315 TaxID=3155142 RepID=UPI0033EC786B
MRRRLTSLLVLATAAALLPFGTGTASATGTTTADPCAPYSAPAPSAAPAAGSDRAPLPPNAAAFMAAYRAWGERPTVEAYMQLFTANGTLMDTGLSAPIGAAAICAQMKSLLKEVPDYTFEPLPGTVSSKDGRVLYVKARNTGTVTVPDETGEPGKEKEIPFDYITTHRLVLDGSRVEQGRRFWDQTELFRAMSPSLPKLFANLTPVAPAPPRTDDRLTAWNTRDSAALVAGVGNLAKLTGPGLDTPLVDRQSARAYLERFFTRAHALNLTPGHTVRQGNVTYREWVGRAVVGPENRDITYGITERFTRTAAGAVEWDLAFETLDLVATQCEIAELRAILFPPAGPTQPCTPPAAGR